MAYTFVWMSEEASQYYLKLTEKEKKRKQNADDASSTLWCYCKMEITRGFAVTKEKKTQEEMCMCI